MTKKCSPAGTVLSLLLVVGTVLFTATSSAQTLLITSEMEQGFSHLLFSRNLNETDSYLQKKINQ